MEILSFFTFPFETAHLFKFSFDSKFGFLCITDQRLLENYSFISQKTEVSKNMSASELKWELSEMFTKNMYGKCNANSKS